MNRLIALILCILFLAACGGGKEANNDALAVTRIKAAELSEKASLAYEMGDYERSLKYYREALRLSRSVEDFHSMSVGAINAVSALRAMGHLDQAEVLLDELLESRYVRTQHSLEAEARYMKALVLLDKDNASEAVVQSGLALDVCAESCDALPRIYNLAARTSLKLDDEAAAYERAQKGLDASRKAEDVREEANALRLLAFLKENEDHYEESAKHYGEALELDKKLALGSKVYHDLMGLGRIAAKLGNDENADEYYKRALSVAEALGDIDGVAQAKHSRATLNKIQ